MKMPLTIYGSRKGQQTGLAVLLSVVTFLFIIGLIIAIFAIIGGEVYDTDTMLEENVVGELSAVEFQLNDSGVSPTGTTGLRDFNYTTATINISVNNTQLLTNNFTVSGSVIYTTCSTYNLSQANITANYTHTTDTTQSIIVNTTTSSLSNTTDFFGIIVVITIMVVLILLTVLIIVSVRNSGLLVSA